MSITDPDKKYNIELTKHELLHMHDVIIMWAVTARDIFRQEHIEHMQDLATRLYQTVYPTNNS